MHLKTYTENEIYFAFANGYEVWSLERGDTGDVFIGTAVECTREVLSSFGAFGAPVAFSMRRIDKAEFEAFVWSK